jgi:hypothetical protein
MMEPELMFRVTWDTLLPLIEEAAFKLFAESEDVKGTLGRWMEHKAEFRQRFNDDSYTEHFVFALVEANPPPMRITNISINEATEPLGPNDGTSHLPD